MPLVIICAGVVLESGGLWLKLYGSRCCEINGVGGFVSTKYGNKSGCQKLRHHTPIRRLKPRTGLLLLCDSVCIDRNSHS